jgi:quinol monooxygenase YgiN
MKAVIAKVTVQEGKAAELEAVAREMVKAVRENEPGNHLYRLCKTAEGGYVFLEMYENDEAIGAHMRSPHMKTLGAKLFALLTGRPELTVLDVVGD